jgi:putative ABC transport system permease protein
VLRVIRLLALRRLRLQPLRALLATLVVGGGSALVVSILVITSSLSQSVDDAGRALAGPAPLRVLGPVQRGGIGPDAVRAIEEVDGVKAAVPLVQSITLVDPGKGRDDIPVTILGFDCRVEAILGDVAGACTDAALASLPGPLIGRGLADEIGSGAAVRTNEGRVSLRGALPVAGLDRLNKGRVVAFPMARALQELDRNGRVDVVYVLPKAGESVPALQHRIQEALPADHRVLDALDPPPIVGVVLASFLPLFTIIALLTLGIGAVLIRNSITLSLEERRRQTAIVGALGGSRRLLIVGTILEVVILGGIGGLVGVGAGVLLSHPISGGLDEITRKIAGIPLTIHVPTSAVVTGILVGVVVALLAAIGPARRAVRIDVAAELASRGRREETAASTSPVRLVLAAGVLAAGLVLSHVSAYHAGLERWRSSLAPVGFLVVTVGSVALVTVAVPMLLAVGERRVHFRRGSSRLALSNLRREPRRSAVMALALGFAMGVGFVTASFNASVTQAITDQLNEHFHGVQVSSIDPNNSATSEARLSPQVISGLRALPGVKTVETGGYVVVGNQAGKLIGVSAYTDPWITGDNTAVGVPSLAKLADGEVVVGPAIARSEHLRPGDHLRLATPDGPIELPVMAVAYNGDFGGRNVLMDYDLMLRVYGPQAPVSVIANPEPGVSERDLERTIRDAHLEPGLHVEGHQAVIDRNAKAVADQLATFDAIQRGLLVMSFVAVLSTLLLVGIQRQKEFGMLAAVGMTPRELRRMVLTEAGIVALLGVLVTGVAAVAQYWALNAIVPVIIGYRDPFVLAPIAFVTNSAIALATAMVAALYPARRAARVEVLDALRYE